MEIAAGGLLVSRFWRVGCIIGVSVPLGGMLGSVLIDDGACGCLGSAVVLGRLWMLMLSSTLIICGLVLLRTGVADPRAAGEQADRISSLGAS